MSVPHVPEATVHPSGGEAESLAASIVGLAVFLSHGYGVSTRYGHLSKIAVEAGQKVRRGDVVGYVGSTGRSTGYHLHYEVLVDGRAVNPLAYVLDLTADSGA